MKLCVCFPLIIYSKSIHKSFQWKSIVFFLKPPTENLYIFKKICIKLLLNYRTNFVLKNKCDKYCFWIYIYIYCISHGLVSFYFTLRSPKTNKQNAVQCSSIGITSTSSFIFQLYIIEIE